MVRLWLFFEVYLFYIVGWVICSCFFFEESGSVSCSVIGKYLWKLICLVVLND